MVRQPRRIAVPDMVDNAHMCNQVTPMKCKVEGCDKKLHGRGLCSHHYQRMYRGMSLEAPLLRPAKRYGCKVEGCEGKHVAKGYCRSHYERFNRKSNARGRKTKTPISRTTKTPINSNKDDVYKKLCSGVLVGNIDPRGYERFSSNGEIIWAHRFVMERILGRKLTTEETVHHRNGVRHDNRPENLELWSGKHPRGARVSEQVAWAQEILAKHKPFDVNALCMVN